MKMNKTLAGKIVASYRFINDEIDCLNYGGCGVFATILCERLKSLGFDAKVFSLMSEEISDADRLEKAHIEYEKNITNLHKAAQKNIDPKTMKVWFTDHYCVGVDGFYFDSSRFSLLSEYHTVVLDDEPEDFDLVGEIPLEDISFAAFSKFERIWNPEYDRSQNDMVREILERVLSKLPS